MNKIRNLKYYIETLSGNVKFLGFAIIVGFIFSALALFAVFGAGFAFSGVWFFLIYWVVIITGAVVVYPKLRSESEITRIRALLTGDILAMAKETESRIFEIKSLWRQFSSRPIFCAAELEETRQTVYRKFLLYQKQQASLNSLPDNSANEEIREARAELDISTKKTLKYLEETGIRLNIVASQIALLESDAEFEQNSSLLASIKTLRDSRKLLAEMSPNAESNEISIIADK